MGCMQISLHLPSVPTHTKPNSLIANCTGIDYTVSLQKRCHFAFRQKRFDFLQYHPENKEIMGGGGKKKKKDVTTMTVKDVGLLRNTSCSPFAFSSSFACRAFSRTGESQGENGETQK